MFVIDLKKLCVILTHKVWLLSLLTLSSVTLSTCTVTQYPALACEGDRVTVSCDMSVPNQDDEFASVLTDFIVGNSAAISDTIINGNDTIGGVDLSKLTAIAIDGNDKNIQGNITLLFYTTADNDTRLGCTNEYFDGGNIANRATLTEILNLRQAAPPSPPVSLTADYNSPTCSGTVQLAWTPGASDRDIEMYFLSLNGVLVDSLDPVTLYYTTTLRRDMEYTYSVVAMSCAGNSTETPATSISVGSYSLSDGSPPFNLSYDQSTSSLSVGWSLVPNTGLRDILIDYSLVLNYTHSQSDSITQPNFSNTTFQQLSTDTDYTVPLTSHPFSTDDGVVTNITVCLQITRQCGLAFSGVNMCAFYNSASTTTAPLNTFPIIIGCVAGVGAILLILIILMFFVMVYLCCICSRMNTADTSDKKSVHMYEDMSETLDRTAVAHPTESQQYTHMSALPKNQLPPNYENMNTF